MQTHEIPTKSSESTLSIFMYMFHEDISAIIGINTAGSEYLTIHMPCMELFWEHMKHIKLSIEHSTKSKFQSIVELYDTRKVS